MAVTLLIVLYGLIQLSVSQFTKTSLCLQGVTNSSYDGTYYYYTTKFNNGQGGVWRNYENGQYLYPWDYQNNQTTGVTWRVGISYTNSTAHLLCSGATSYMIIFIYIIHYTLTKQYKNLKFKVIMVITRY